ncbi:hypothetical protein LDENG_00073850 [Lucifuga dentata]|nr:hypothetical protein LDENG_00073850 [Lucifuga dentata]
MQSLTMKTLIFLLYTFHLLAAQPKDVDRYAYCESCLTTANEIEKAMKEAPAESRQKVIESLISGGVCERLLFYKNNHLYKHMKSSCIHLLDNHSDQFYAALVNKEPKHLDIILCYEQSAACVGVKRKSFENSKSPFKNSDIDALLQDNKEKVRLTQPVRSGSPFPSKDEL